MLELIDARSSWNRSLWQIGTIQSIYEVLECTQATWDGKMNTDAAQKYVISRCQSQVKSDIGIGSADVRELIVTKLGQIASKPISGASANGKSVQQHPLVKEIEELTDRAKRDYLQRWNQHVAAGELAIDGIERAARLIVTHLLDEGFSSTHIHGWLRSTLDKTATDVLTEILTQSQAMCRATESEHSFAVVLRGRIGTGASQQLESVLLDKETLQVEYEQSTQGSGMLNSEFHRRMSGEGGIFIGKTFMARDPHAAGSKLDDWLQKLESRSSLGNRSKIQFSRIVLDRSDKKMRNLTARRNPVIIPAMQRHGLFASELSPQLDAALALLGSSQQLSADTSVATLWAAVEGLLQHQGAKGHECADYLAAIVACSFPRAEIEDLIDRPMTESAISTGARDGLDETSGSERAGLMLASIKAHGSEIFMDPIDVAAAERVLQLEADPSGTIVRIKDYFADTFRRLYYQRNFVMHAAKFNSVSLPTTVRTAPKLVAAGLDRVVHAQYIRRPIEPLALAGRANNEIHLLGKQGARDIYRLLK